MFAHVLQDLIGRIVSGLKSTLGSDRQRVYQSLRMSLPDIHQKLMDETAHELSLSVDSSDQLRDHLEPSIDVDGPHSFNQSFINFWPMPVIEP